MFSLRGVLFLMVCGWMLVLPTRAQPADTLLAFASAALEQGQYEASSQALEKLIRQSKHHAEAHYLMARLYLEPEYYNLKRSQESIKKALKVAPRNPDYLAVRLLHQQASTSPFLPSWRREKQRMLAAKILKLDPENAIAHEELGLQALLTFEQYDHAATLRHAHGACASRFDIACQRAAGAAFVDLNDKATQAYGVAHDHFQKALTNDPRRRLSYDYLMRLYAARSSLSLAQSLLDTMRLHFSEDAGFWRYQGWLYYQTGALAEAESAFEQALRLMDPATQEAFEDLSLLLISDEAKAYRSDPQGFGAMFWSGKDPRYLTSYNERRLEHFARLVYADIFFAVPLLNRRGWDTDRGRIFLRYGPPQQRYFFRNTRFYGTDPNEAGRAGTFIVWEYDTFRFVFEDPDALLNNEYRLYSPSATEYARSIDAVSEASDYVLQSSSMARTMPERSQFAPPGERQPIPFLVSVFKGPNTQADIHIPYGLPLPADSQQEAEPGISGLFLLDQDHTLLHAQKQPFRTSASSPAIRLSDGKYAVQTGSMHAPSGTYLLSVEFERGDQNGFERQTLTIPDFAAGMLQVSDVMPAYLVEEGEASAQGAIFRKGHTIFPAPATTFSRDQLLYLYFEVYGLATNDQQATSYDIEAVLLPLQEKSLLQKLKQKAFGGETTEGVSARFSGSGTMQDEGHYLILDTHDQPAGRYLLALQVRDHITQKRVETEREIVLE